MNNLKKKYSKVPGEKLQNTVNGVTFSIAENEVMGILGPSGAGKSSIFKMVTMAIKRTEGTIKMMGKDF